MRSVLGYLFLLALVEDSFQDQYSVLPWGRLMSRFNKIVQNTNSNNGVMTEEDSKALTALKKAILEDCASGKLTDFSAKNLYKDTIMDGFPTKPYLLNMAKSVTQDTFYWVLPAVDCNYGAETGTRKETISASPSTSSDEDQEDSGSYVSEEDDSNDAEQDEPEKGPSLADDDTFTKFIKKERTRLQTEVKRTGITMAGVKKPPKFH